MAASRPRRSSTAKKRRASLTDNRARSAIDRSRKRTASASGLSRRPSHAEQAWASSSYHSFHQISSPLCSASKPRSFKPVPKHVSHQPCFELNENRRGSSSAKLRLHTGHARLVENVDRAAPGKSSLTLLFGCTCTTPLPNSSARESASRNALSASGPTTRLATGSSIECSLKRSSRGQRAVGSIAPSTESSAKPLRAAHFARSV